MRTLFTCGARNLLWHCQEREDKNGSTFLSCDSDDEGMNRTFTGSLVYNEETDYGYIYSVDWVSKGYYSRSFIEEINSERGIPTVYKKPPEYVQPERRTKVIEFNCTEYK